MDNDLISQGKRVIGMIVAAGMVGASSPQAQSPAVQRRNEYEQPAEDALNDFQEWGGEYMETNVLNNCYIADEDIPEHDVYFVMWSDGELTQQREHPDVKGRIGRTVDKFHVRRMRGVKSNWDNDTVTILKDGTRVTGGVGAGGFSWADAVMAHVDKDYVEIFQKWERGEELTFEEHRMMVNHRQFMKKQNLNARFQKTDGNDA